MFRTETHHYFELPNGVEVELPFEPEDWLQDELVAAKRPDGGYRVAYLMHDDYCQNPLEECDGMGVIWHHPRSRYGKSDGYYEACGLDSYGDPIIDEDKLQQMWHDKVMAIPPELFTFPDELVEHRWEPKPIYSSKGEPVPYWIAMRRWLADESAADVSLLEQCNYAWRAHVDDDVIEAVYDQIEPHFSFSYAAASQECQKPMDKYACLLDVYEHGARAYSLSGGGMQCRWDTSRGEAVWVADKYAKEEIDRRARVYAFGMIESVGTNTGKPMYKVSPLSGVESSVFEEWSDAFEFLRQFGIHYDGELTPEDVERGFQRALYEVAKNCVEAYDSWQRGDNYGVICVDYDAEGKQVGGEDACWGYIGLDYAREERDKYLTIPTPQQENAQ
jgi:hypothetical protein